MARKQVLEIECDRCKKVETQPIPKGPDADKKAEVVVSFRGEEVVYGDLCTRCRRACENYFKSMTRQTDDDKADETEPKAAAKKGLLGGLGRATG